MKGPGRHAFDVFDAAAANPYRSALGPRGNPEHERESRRSLGADRVIDYTTTDFTTEGATYDLIFDSIENRSLSDVRRALKPNGTLLLNSGRDAGGLRGLVKLLRPLVLSLFGPQTLRRFLSHPNAADLAVLADLVDQGKLRPVIDSTFPLPETVAALRRVEAGHARGKVVIAVAA